MVVAMEPASKCAGAVGLSAVGPDVGPLLEQGAMETLDLAVGLGPVGPAVLVDDAAFGKRVVEQSTPVGEGIVGQDPLDHHPPGPEPRLGSSPEARGGAALLVGQDLGVGEAGVGGRCGVGVRVTPPAVSGVVAVVPGPRLVRSGA